MKKETPVIRVCYNPKKQYLLSRKIA